MNQISIPKPCHENWENMQPEEQGKHCLACNKIVIDFSGWEQEQIMDYLQDKRGEKVCGRFNIGQLELQEDKVNTWQRVLTSNLSILKKIAAIVLLCFGMMTTTQSYAQKKKVEVSLTKPANPEKVKTSERLQQQLMGDTIMVDTPSCKNAITRKKDSLKYEPQIMGKIKVYDPPKRTPTKKPTNSTKNKQ